MSRNNGSDKRVSRVTVATSVNSRWKSRDCDFLCDGIDDNVEINNAIQSLPEDGGEIVILDGTYNISSSILLNKNNTKISGNGKSTKFVRGWDSSSEEGMCQENGKMLRRRAPPRYPQDILPHRMLYRGECRHML